MPRQVSGWWGGLGGQAVVSVDLSSAARSCWPLDGFSVGRLKN